MNNENIMNQLNQIINNIEFGDKIDTDMYAIGFNQDQIYEIILGIESNIDVKEYAKLEIPAYEMRKIRLDMLRHIRK